MARGFYIGTSLDLYHLKDRRRWMRYLCIRTDKFNLEWMWWRKSGTLLTDAIYTKVDVITKYWETLMTLQKKYLLQGYKILTAEIRLTDLYAYEKWFHNHRYVNVIWILVYQNIINFSRSISVSIPLSCYKNDSWPSRYNVSSC